MSMLSNQCDQLERSASLLEEFASGMDAPYILPDTKSLMFVAMLQSAIRMREAAETIRSLSEKLRNALNDQHVRCRDCRHYIDGECMVEDGNGDYLRLTVPPTHFCAWGERRGL